MIQSQTVFRTEDVQAWEELYPEETPIGRAIAGFRNFSQDYQAYYDGIIGRGEFDQSKTTADRLRAQVSQSLESYWAPLGEVAMQWQIKHYRQHLDEGSRLAQIYLDKLRPELPGVLVYFNKVATIKYCPYSDRAFVGTPYARLAAGDWMAIPHELGHYLYWNAGGSLKETRRIHREIQGGATKKLQEEAVPESQRLLLMSWLEETFCDVIGTRIGGVEFTTRIVDLLKSCAGNVCELTQDDGRHPPPCLRPFVREHTLTLNGETSRSNWSAFFSSVFGKSEAELNLRATSPDLRSIVKHMTKKELLMVLEAEDALEIMPTVRYPQLRLIDIVPAMNVMVEYLNSQAGTLLAAFQPPVRDVHPFGNLLDLAAEESASLQIPQQLEGAPFQRKSLPPYEILLRPRILEGGDWHGPHECWAHFAFHEVGEHPH